MIMLARAAGDPDRIADAIRIVHPSLLDEIADARRRPQGSSLSRRLVASMQTSSARSAGLGTLHRESARSWVVRVVLVLVLVGVALVQGAPAVSAQSVSAPCRLLKPREIATRIGEKVGTGAPDEVVPGSCGYPLGDAKPISVGTGAFVRSFAVAVLDATKCGTTRASKGMSPVRVGKKTGIYDTTGVFRAGHNTVHMVGLWVIAHGQCLSLSWDRRPGPLPSGSAATRARQVLVELGRLVTRRM
jgi:hypothetical protein